MFSGIVEGIGTIVRATRRRGAVRLAVDADGIAGDTKLGDSIAVDGTCLTVVSRRARLLEFDVVSETLARTTLGTLRPRSRVNLERSLRLSDRVGGHLVTGHVDGLGTIVAFDRRPGEAWLTVEAPPDLAVGMLLKGSIAIAGVSLTIAHVDGERFSVALVPHTLRVTTFNSLVVGDPVNLETDVLGKWVRRLLEQSGALSVRAPVRRSRRVLR